MEENPYQPPLDVDDSAVETPPAIRVEPPYLVVASGVRLPRRCAITDQPVRETDLVTRRLFWAPTFRLVWARQRCDVEYYVHAKRRRRHRLSALITPCLLMLVFLAGLLLDGIVLRFMGVMGALLTAPFLPRDPIHIHRAQQGRFWLKGFGPAFLDRCSRELDAGESR